MATGKGTSFVLGHTFLWLPGHLFYSIRILFFLQLFWSPIHNDEPLHSFNLPQKEASLFRRSDRLSLVLLLLCGGRTPPPTSNLHGQPKRQV